MDKELSVITIKAKKLGQGGIEKLSRATAEYKKGYKIIKNKYDDNTENENENLYNILYILIGVLTTYAYKEEKKRKIVISKIHNYQKQLETNVKPKSTKDKEEKIKFYIVSFECFYNIGTVYGLLLESITKTKDTKTNPYPIINKATDYFYKSTDNKNAHFYASKLKENGLKDYYITTIEAVTEIYCNENVEQWDIALTLYKTIHKESQGKITSNQYYNLGRLSLDCYQYEFAIEYFTTQLVMLKKERNTAGKLQCLKLLLECYFSSGDYITFDDIMEHEIEKNYQDSYDGLSEMYDIKQSSDLKELRVVQELELKSIPESSHALRIPVIEKILSLLYQEKEEDVYYVEEKLQCFIGLEECFKKTNKYEKLNQIYEEHSCLLDHQVTKKYFRQSTTLNKLIIDHCKSNVLFSVNYNLKILFIIAKINLSNALDSLENTDEAIDHLIEVIKELTKLKSSDINQDEMLTVLDNTLIATSNMATIYRKLGNDKKYKLHTKVKEELEFEIQELKNKNQSSQTSSQLSRISLSKSRSKTNNHQLHFKKSTTNDDSDDYIDDSDQSQRYVTHDNLSLENLSVEDTEEPITIGPIKNTTKSSIKYTTTTSTNEILAENLRKNKLELLVKKSKEKSKVANEITSEEYLQQIQINENNKRELYDPNSNVQFKKTRRNLIIDSEYEIIGGIEYSKLTGLPIDIPATTDEFIKYSKEFPPPPPLFSTSSKNNELPQSPSNKNDPIIINDLDGGKKKKQLGFRVTTPNYEREFNTRQANEDFEEEEYHPPEHYDANGVLLPCHTKNFIVPDEEEEEDNYYGDKPKKKKSNKNNSNNNTSTNITTVSSPIKSSNNNSNSNNISNTTSPTKSNNLLPSSSTSLQLYRFITVTIFLDISLYIPIFGVDSKQLDLQWLKERIEDRIKLLGYDDFKFEIDYFTLNSNSTHPIQFKTKILDVLKTKNFKCLKSNFKSKQQDELQKPELMEDLDILNNNDELSNGFHCDDSDTDNHDGKVGLVIGDSNLIQVLTFYYMETFRNRLSIQSVFISDLRLSNSNLVIVQLSQLLSTCPNINSLSFINCGFNKDSMNKLSNSIQSLKSITKLNFSLNQFSSLESFPHVASITHLDLSGCNLMYNSFKVIYDSLLSISNSLVVLKLNENPDIGNRGFSLLTSDQGRFVLSRLIQFEIRLSLGNLDIGTLGKLFKCCSNITTLDIGNNSIGSGNGSKLNEITSSLSPSSIINNNVDDDEIMGFNSISKLSMDEIDLPNASSNNRYHIQSICKLIENSNKLVYLKLQNNNIGLAGSKLLVKHLPLAKLLSKILLRCCNLTMIGIFTILYNCLNSNSELKYLDLSRNTNTDDEINNSSSDINSLGVSIRMFDSKPNLNIEYLNLSENNIDYDYNKHLESFKLKWKLYNYKSPLSESSTLIFENN